MSRGLGVDEELARLLTGGCADAPPSGMSLFEIDAEASGAARQVLDRSREVLTTILRAMRSAPAGGKASEPALPQWFLDASGPERSPAEAREWLDELARMPEAERENAEAAERWSVSDFLYWFEPDQREWWWWGAEVRDEDNVRICLVIREFSVPHEALDWLLRASGAQNVVDENVRDLS